MYCCANNGILKYEFKAMIVYTKKPEPWEKCRLNEANGLDEWCTRQSCIFWRLLEPQDIKTSNKEGCGLVRNGYLEVVPEKISNWLLRAKSMLEDTTPTVGKSRIIFKRRERK